MLEDIGQRDSLARLSAQHLSDQILDLGWIIDFTIDVNFKFWRSKNLIDGPTKFKKQKLKKRRTIKLFVKNDSNLVWDLETGIRGEPELNVADLTICHRPFKTHFLYHVFKIQNVLKNESNFHVILWFQINLIIIFANWSKSSKGGQPNRNS